MLSRLLDGDGDLGGGNRSCYVGQTHAAFRRSAEASAQLRACADAATDSALRRDALERLGTVLADAGDLDGAARTLAELLRRFGAMSAADAVGWRSVQELLTARAQGQSLRLSARLAGETRVRRNQLGMTLVPAEVNGRADELLLDTGAGMSVLIESVAESLGVQPLPGGLRVAGSTGVQMQGRVGLGRVVLAGATLDNVPFLILPDSALNVRAGPVQLQVRGILGLPVLLALEEIELTADGLLRVPAAPRLNGRPNLALDGTRLLIEATFTSGAGVLSLDTGARSTTLYPPAQRLVGSAAAAGTRGTLQMGGAGGTRSYAMTRLPEVQVAIGDTVVVLRQVPLLTEAPNDRAKYAAGNLGQDVLGAYPTVTMNFRQMILKLGHVPAAPGAEARRER